MSIFSAIGDFFAIDIGTTAVRVVQLKGSSRGKVLVRYGSAPTNIQSAHSNSPADVKRLGDAVNALIKQTGISTRNVVVGIPSDKMFSTVVDMPKLSKSELTKTIQYQAEQLIPMPLDEVKMDWALLGDSPVEADKVEVLLSSVAKTYAETRMELLEAIGLNVIALEPDGMALMRSVVQKGTSGAVMVLDIGDRATDLVVAMNDAPRLIRSVPIGGHSLIKAATQNLNVDEKQAQQFVHKFGLSQDKLEGQVYKALEPTIGTLISEIEKSIKFFGARYSGVPVEKIIVSGGASTLPGFPLHLANNMGIAVEIGNAWQNVSYPNNLHNDLLAISSQFAVVTGLAEREE